MEEVSLFFWKILDIVLHVDVYLREAVTWFGPYVYLLLFVIVFCETGLVVTPFLPGDSLLFAAGTLAGIGILDYLSVVLVLLGAAFIGDGVNYRIGKYIGPPVFEKNYKYLKKEYLLAAQHFYDKHGGKAIILARFMPIVRTFAPFIAGVASMHPGRFAMFNITGACIWVFGLVSAGYFLGDLPIVRENFSILIYFIILVSCLPVVIGGVKTWLSSRQKI